MTLFNNLSLSRSERIREIKVNILAAKILYKFKCLYINLYVGQFGT